MTSRCSVGLGEFEMEEELNQVPSCRRVPRRLHSNSTCPLCRCSIYQIASVTQPPSGMNIAAADFSQNLPSDQQHPAAPPTQVSFAILEPPMLVVQGSSSTTISTHIWGPTDIVHSWLLQSVVPALFLFEIVGKEIYQRLMVPWKI